MIRTIDGLLWQVNSPSEYQLLSVRDDIDGPDAVVRVRFTGRKWCIDYRSGICSLIRAFNSREAAMKLIAERAP